MDFALTDPAAASLVIGLALLGIDIFLIGVSPLMFVAAATLLTSGLLYVTGWRPSLLAAAAVASVLSLAVAAVGWRPLRAFQSADVEEDESSDFIGRELVTTHEVTRTGGRVHWSGSEWSARLCENAGVEKVGAGEKMRIVKVDNLALVLAPVAPPPHIS